MGKGDGRSQEVFGGKVRVWGGPRGAGAASGQRRRGGWVRAGEGSAQGLRRATASVGEGGEDGSGAPAERLKLGLVLRGRKRVDGIPWKSGGEVLGRVGPVRVRGAWRRAGTPWPPSERGGCVGAGEGRPEGMERDTESLGPCGEVVRGILGDRFKVGFGGCCGGGGFCCWFLVFGWLVGVRGEEGGG